MSGRIVQRNKTGNKEVPRDRGAEPGYTGVLRDRGAGVEAWKLRVVQRSGNMGVPRDHGAVMGAWKLRAARSGERKKHNVSQ